MRTTQSEQSHQAAYAPVLESKPVNLNGISTKDVTFETQGLIFGLTWDDSRQVIKPKCLNDPNIVLYGLPVCGTVQAFIQNVSKLNSIKIFINNKQI